MEVVKKKKKLLENFEKIFVFIEKNILREYVKNKRNLIFGFKFLYYLVRYEVIKLRSKVFGIFNSALVLYYNVIMLNCICGFIVII